MNFFQIQGAIELGMIFGLVAMGVYLSFRILQFPDLTVDGSFPLGAAVTASLMSLGWGPIPSLFFSTLSGSLAGLITAVLATRLGMLNLLASILTMSALYSVNLRVMGGKPSLSLLGQSTLFQDWSFTVPGGIDHKVIILFFGVVCIGFALRWFFQTDLGLAMRATGNNPRMAQAQGVSDKNMITLGLALSNGLVALAGGLFCQAYGFADVSLGVGTIVVGLASLILGEVLFSPRKIAYALFATVAGSVLYRLMVSLALDAHDLGLQASDLNLVTAVLVTITTGIPILNRLRAKKVMKVA